MKENLLIMLMCLVFSIPGLLLAFYVVSEDLRPLCLWAGVLPLLFGISCMIESLYYYIKSKINSNENISNNTNRTSY